MGLTCNLAIRLLENEALKLYPLKRFYTNRLGGSRYIIRLSLVPPSMTPVLGLNTVPSSITMPFQSHSFIETQTSLECMRTYCFVLLNIVKPYINFEKIERSCCFQTLDTNFEKFFDKVMKWQIDHY